MRSKVLVFGVAFAASLVLFAPRPAASSVVHTIPADTGIWGPIPSDLQWLKCGFQAGTAFTSGVQGAYFDFHVDSPSNEVTISLWKRSYTGALYADTHDGTYSTGPQDVFVYATNTGGNLSAFDYWWAQFEFFNGIGSTPYGVGLLTNN
jgi:hypothetical protein